MLEARLGQERLRQRLERERRRERRVAHPLRRFLDVEHWEPVIRGSLRLTGLHERGRRNALAIAVTRNEVGLRRVPRGFEGFTLLHLSDLHVDISADFLDALIARVASLDYDLCVLTGDYRARTFGPFDAALEGLARLRPHLRGAVYAVLGNHDSVRMVPSMEAMGYSVLFDEWRKIERGGEAVCLAGIDDVPSRHGCDLRPLARGMPDLAASILLSHRPRPYRQAAEAGFSFMLSGHTHGGQFCLPGGIPVLTHGERAFARGAWRHRDMLGYTSVGAGSCVVAARFNCPPEVTLHRLRRQGA